MCVYPATIPCCTNTPDSLLKYCMRAKRGAEIVKDRTSECYQLMSSSSIPLPSVQFGQMAAFPNDPFFVLVPTTSPQNDSVFTSISHLLGVAITADWTRKRYQVKACCSLPLHKVQSIHWQHCQQIFPLGSF